MGAKVPSSKFPLIVHENIITLFDVNEYKIKVIYPQHSSLGIHKVAKRYCVSVYRIQFGNFVTLKRLKMNLMTF
jgi:hypothetical protein